MQHVKAKPEIKGDSSLQSPRDSYTYEYDTLSYPIIQCTLGVTELNSECIVLVGRSLGYKYTYVEVRTCQVHCGKNICVHFLQFTLTSTLWS